MRKLLFVLFLFVATAPVCMLNAQNTWLQKASFGGGNRDDGSGFAIGNTGYILSGTDTGGYFTDMWAWNSDSNVWRQKASFPGGKRIGSRSVSLNGYGYVLGGEEPASCFIVKKRTAVCLGTFFGDNWRYNPDSNTWLKLDTFPGAPRDFGVAVADPNDSTIYFGTGNDNDSAYLSDWWAFYTPTGAWTQLADFPGGQRCNDVGFFINGDIYVGTGNDNDSANYATSDFWKYTPATNTWTRLPDLPGIPRRCASAFTIGNYGYVCLGVGDTTYTSGGWRYNPATNNWAIMANYGGGVMADGIGFTIGSKGYVGTGMYDGNDYSQFWEYTFDSILNVPNPINPAEFNLYPNPNNGKFTIQSSGVNSHPDSYRESVAVYNELGELVNSPFTTHHSQFTLDLSGQPCGIYFYQILDSGKVINSGKFIIAR